MATLEDLDRALALKKLDTAIQAKQEPQTIKAGVPFMTADGPAVLQDGQIVPMSQEQFDISTGATQTAGQIGRESLGLDPDIVTRGTILPIGKTASGERTLAVPEMLLAAPQAIATGTAATQGAPITGQELVETTLAAAAPATGGVKGVSRIAKAQQLPKKLVKSAPSTKKLIQEGGKRIDDYVKTGDSVSGDDFSMFWVRADDMLRKAGFDEETTPAIAKQMRSLSRRADKDFIEPQEMVNIRRGIKDLMKSPNIEPTDKRLAAKLLDEFDDFALTVPGGQGWKAGRNVYAKGKKSQQIEDALEVAQNTASGVENGIRIELRKILKSPKKSLGFTKEEKQAMQDIVRGNFTRNSLKKLSMLSFGSGQQRNPFAGFGAIAGAGAGSPFGAPGAMIGAAVPGAVGAVAQKGLERSTINAVKALRALTAGTKIPESVIFKDTLLTPRALAGITASSIEEVQ